MWGLKRKGCGAHGRTSPASILLLTLLLLAAAACRQRQPSAKQETAPEVLFASTIATGDPQYAGQLMRGFYPIEHSWRWTQKTFAAHLAVPKGAAQKGAQLQLRFAVPEPLIEKLKSVTLSASVNGSGLKPETYEKAGQYAYTRDVPAGALQAKFATAEFALDRALPPGPVDLRELGIIVTEVGLTTKE